VLLEAGSDVYEPLDLGFGRCRLVVAGRAGERPAVRVSTVRVATKYPRVTRTHFEERGVSVEVVRLAGSVELAPGLGLADCIVDVVETGRTLADNGLEVVEEVAASSARLIVNRASYQARREDVRRLIDRLRTATP
jgi:ATP phosphoribosyltransferase